MNDGFTTKRGLKQLDQNFRKIGLSSIDSFITNNLTKNQGLSTEMYTPIAEKHNHKFLSYMRDDGHGNGRITQGVKSLHAITKTFMGISGGSLTLFDQTIFSNPYNFKEYNTIDARAVIYENLGVTVFMITAKIKSPKIIIDFDKMVDRMFLDMRNLTFTYDKYINEALIRCKLVVNASMNYRDNR